MAASRTGDERGGCRRLSEGWVKVKDLAREGFYPSFSYSPPVVADDLIGSEPDENETDSESEGSVREEDADADPSQVDSRHTRGTSHRVHFVFPCQSAPPPHVADSEVLIFFFWLH